MQLLSGIQNRKPTFENASTERANIQNNRSVHADFKRTQLTHTYKTDRRLDSAAMQLEISTVSAQLCSCYLVPVASEKSPTTNARPPSRLLYSTSHLPKVFYCTQKATKGLPRRLMTAQKYMPLNSTPYELLSTSGLAGCLADVTYDYEGRSGRGSRTLNTQRAASLTHTRPRGSQWSRATERHTRCDFPNQPRHPHATHRLLHRPKSVLKKFEPDLKIATSPQLAMPRSLTPI